MKAGYLFLSVSKKEASLLHLKTGRATSDLARNHDRFHGSGMPAGTSLSALGNSLQNRGEWDS